LGISKSTILNAGGAYFECRSAESCGFFEYVNEDTALRSPQHSVAPPPSFRPASFGLAPAIPMLQPARPPPPPIPSTGISAALSNLRNARRAIRPNSRAELKQGGPRTYEEFES
jgi:hypothetical protein